MDNYIHLRDNVLSDDSNNVGRGQLLILLSSHTGSPRYMHEKTQDALVYVRHFGRPDLFITFTCSTSWPEIADELLSGQIPKDRYDLSARVFHLTLKAMI